MRYIDWATKNANPNYVSAAKSAANKYGVPPDLYLGLIKSESNWKPDILARNRDGSLAKDGGAGIAQFVRSTAKEMGIDRMNPYQSLDAGAKYLRKRFDDSGGSWAGAVKGYKGKRDTTSAGNTAVFNLADELDAGKKGVSRINSNPVPTPDSLAETPPPAIDEPTNESSGNWLDFIKNIDLTTILFLLIGVFGLLISVYQLSFIDTKPLKDSLK